MWRIQTNEKVLPLIEFGAVKTSIVHELTSEEGLEIMQETRNEMRAQLKEIGVEMQLSYPYYTGILETGVEYENSEWMIIYGIEILEGEGDAIMSFVRSDTLKMRGASEDQKYFISPKGIIVPELSDFELKSKTKMRYMLVGEGHNNPKIEKYVEKTYIRTQKMIDDDKEANK
jgi:hypothetical protein